MEGCFMLNTNETKHLEQVNVQSNALETYAGFLNSSMQRHRICCDF